MKYGTDYTRVREAYPETHVIRDFFGAEASHSAD